jgi:hypothetical protein
MRMGAERNPDLARIGLVILHADPTVKSPQPIRNSSSAHMAHTALRKPAGK